MAEKPDNWEGMLRELLDDESDTMSAWEIGFIESIERKSKREGFSPSPRQAACLNKIWNRVFGSTQE